MPSFSVSSLLLGGAAVRAGAVAAHPAAGRQLQRAGQAAVVGEQQQALGIEVEPADRDHPRQARRAGARTPSGGPCGSLWVVTRPDGLVVAQQPRRLGSPTTSPSTVRMSPGADLDRRRGQHLAVEGHAARPRSAARRRGARRRRRGPGPWRRARRPAVVAGRLRSRVLTRRGVGLGSWDRGP